MSGQEDYFGLSGGGDERPREELLEGICDELRGGANDALDGLQLLKYAEFFQFGMMGEAYEDFQDKITGVFREFSSAELTDSGTGLQTMINSYEPVWRNLGHGSLTELKRARELMDSWRGEAAEDVKTYLDNLAETYDAIGAEITVVESVVAAARDSVWGARDDLNKLAETFKETARKYQKDKAKEGEISWSKVAAVAFSAALIGMLSVVATPAAGAAAGGLTMSAVGTEAAVAGAGAGITEVVAEATTKVEGDNAMEIFQSFMEHTDKLRENMKAATARFVQKVHEKSNNIPPIPDPPDVSPGNSFDPSNFETSNTPKDTEKRVRDRKVDLTPDDSQAAPPLTASAMD
ncbi:hypothetical protein [Amycolatopsis benzoatilytica]|uniref:hypothetical protein n=1 Tax=Amycolatopsis benzoatilytica TaxID=346045 RepID=UPI00035FD49D|nr:hypothetical protein [Amycolatopsis benzoatilytica]